MKKHKTINEVLKKGQRSINVPVGIIMFGVPIFTIGISLYLKLEGYLVLVIVFGFLFGFVLAWIWWSFKIAKWRIWAFENTNKKDWANLKHRAVIDKVIWPDGSIFEMTEWFCKSNISPLPIKQL